MKCNCGKHAGTKEYSLYYFVNRFHLCLINCLFRFFSVSKVTTPDVRVDGVLPGTLQWPRSLTEEPTVNPGEHKATLLVRCHQGSHRQVCFHGTSFFLIDTGSLTNNSSTLLHTGLWLLYTKTRCFFFTQSYYILFKLRNDAGRSQLDNWMFEQEYKMLFASACFSLRCVPIDSARPSTPRKRNWLILARCRWTRCRRGRGKQQRTWSREVRQQWKRRWPWPTCTVVHPLKTQPCGSNGPISVNSYVLMYAVFCFVFVALFCKLNKTVWIFI